MTLLNKVFKVLKLIKFYLVCVEIAFSMICMISAWYIFPKKYYKKIRILWAKSQLNLFNVKVFIEGEADKDVGLLLINHRSMLDILVLEGVYPSDLSWLAKESIRKIPFFGQIITKAEMIGIDRESKTSMLKMIKEAKVRLKEGRVIAMFPEGTRTHDYDLLPFKKGGEVIANLLKLKVQPVLIVNTREILDTKNKEVNISHDIYIKILPAVQADKKIDWYDKMQKDMQKELHELANSNANR